MNLAHALSSSIRKSKYRTRSDMEVGPHPEKNKVGPDDRLHVLVDDAAKKLVDKVYKDYVSDQDYTHLVSFIRDFDSLLAKYRGNRPLTKQEEERIAAEQGEEEDLAGPEEGEDEEDEIDSGENNMKTKPQEAPKEGEERNDSSNSITSYLRKLDTKTAYKTKRSLKSIAATHPSIIMEQLGGSKFRAMTGAKNFVHGKNHLQFDLPRGAKNKSNRVVIHHNGKDLYDMHFHKLRGLDLHPISKHKDLSAEQLQPVFTRETGLDAHL